MENTKAAPITVDSMEGTSISVVGDTYRILITGEQTTHAYAAIDMLVPPGGGPGPHAHAGFQESFYIVEGEIEFKSEISTYTAKKGSFVEIPKGGLVHCFKNKTSEIAHLLCFVVPSGLEEFFLEIGKPVLPGSFLPPPPLNAEDLKRLAHIAAKYGQKIFPPDYLG